MTAPTLPPVGPDWRVWARQITSHLSRYFVRNPAPYVEFDLNNPVDVSQGQVSWNNSEDTLDVGHADGVVQQVGLEQFARAMNDTGATITNGTVVSFDGAGADAEIEIAEYIADASIPALYVIGVATQDIADGEVGKVTTFGKVRGIDTTGGGESWSVGDVLYASPDTAGEMTNVRPTAPDEVVVVAAVLSVDASEGEIIVRPVFGRGKDYGRFLATSDQDVSSTNTAYAVEFDTTSISHGITVENDSEITATQSGFYKVDVSAQLVTDSNKGYMYIWTRKNGTDIDNSTRRASVESSDDVRGVSYSVEISLADGDYIEIMYAADTTDFSFEAASATSFAPSTAAVMASINQIQL